MRLGLPLGRLDRDRRRSDNRPLALEPGDLVLLEEKLDALRVLQAHGPRPLHRGTEVELQRAGRDPVVARVPHLVGERRALQQGFGGDASPQNTGAAQALSFDHADGQSELRRADRTYVPGGSAADEDHVKRGHVFLD